MQFISLLYEQFIDHFPISPQNKFDPDQTPGYMHSTFLQPDNIDRCPSSPQGTYLNLGPSFSSPTPTKVSTPLPSLPRPIPLQPTHLPKLLIQLLILPNQQKPQSQRQRPIKQHKRRTSPHAQSIIRSVVCRIYPCSE